MLVHVAPELPEFALKPLRQLAVGTESPTPEMPSKKRMHRHFLTAVDGKPARLQSVEC